MKPKPVTINTQLRMRPSGTIREPTIHANFSADEIGRIGQILFLQKLEEFAQAAELPEIVASLRYIMKSIVGKADATAGKI